MNRTTNFSLICVIALTILTLGCRPAPLAYAQAPPPPQQNYAPAPPPPASGDTTTVQGTVRNLSYGPAGDTNGFILDQGTEVHVPPDQLNQLTSVAPIGAQVQVNGWIHTGPAGDTHVDATTITNVSTRSTATFQTPPPPPGPRAPPPPRGLRLWGPPPPPPPGPPPMAAASAPTTTVAGGVRSLSYGPAGDVNGVILDQGIEVHVPPDQANQLNSIAPIGSRIQASGWIHTGPLGDTHVDAMTITNLNTGSTASFQTPPPPPGPGAPPPPGPAGLNASLLPTPVSSVAAPPPMAPQPGLGVSASSPDGGIIGTVRSFNYGPSGEVNGLILDNGTVAYFSPDQSNQVTTLVQVGSRVRVRGWVRQGPAGNALLEAETITNRKTGNSILVANQAPPPPR
jgi:hypothetical protein